MNEMNIEQLKKKLEPWIRSILRDEAVKDMERKLEDARQALEHLIGFGLGVKPKKNGMKIDWGEDER